MITHLRHVLSWPLLVLQFVVAMFFQAFGWTLRLLDRVYRGGLPHIYLPIVHAKRLVRGEPRWQTEDCLKLGLQPRTDDERARADNDERLIRLECVCGQEDCTTDGMYIARDSFND